MAKSRVISFRSSAADDWEFDDEDNLIAPGNQWNSAFVAEALKAIGYQVEVPRNYRDYGWEFGCSTGGDKFWLMIAMGPEEGENYLWVEKVGLFKRLLSGEAARDTLVAHLQKALGSDPRFSTVHEAHV